MLAVIMDTFLFVDFKKYLTCFMGSPSHRFKLFQELRAATVVIDVEHFPRKGPDRAAKLFRVSTE